MGGYYQYDRMMDLLEELRDTLPELENCCVSEQEDWTKSLEQALVHLEQNKKNIEDEIARVGGEPKPE